MPSQSLAGLLLSRKARSTRTQVGLFRSLEAGIETDPRLPYATVCIDHGGCVCHETRTAAMQWLSHPEDWCPDCQAENCGTCGGGGCPECGCENVNGD